MRGLSDGGLEGPRKVEMAQARDLRELSDCKIALEVRCDVFPHPGQPASIESLVRELLEIFIGGETAMTMHQPRCQAHRQRFGQQPATGSLGPQPVVATPVVNADPNDRSAHRTVIAPYHRRW